jgi:hypothetical protein
LHVAADADLAIFAGNARRAQGEHLDRILRRCEALERPLAQRIENDVTPRRDTSCNCITAQLTAKASAKRLEARSGWSSSLS